jgi:hypothetical protein
MLSPNMDDRPSRAAGGDRWRRRNE